MKVFQDKIVMILLYHMFEYTPSKRSTMISTQILIFALGFFYAGVKSDEPKLVHTPNGPILGSLRNTSLTSYLSFQGLPYASPPVGSLRLAPTRAPSPHSTPSLIIPSKHYGNIW